MTNHSDLLAVISTQPQTHHSSAVAAHKQAFFFIIKSFFIFSPPAFTTVISHTPPHTLHFPAIPTASLSYILLFFSHRSRLFIRSFSSHHLFPTLSAFLFSCHSPLLSSFSHAPVREHNEMAMAGLWCVCACARACVCLCDVTLQKLYSSSLF